MKNNKLTIVYDTERLSPLKDSKSLPALEVLKCKSIEGASKILEKRNKDYVRSASFIDKEGKTHVIQ